jgi:hypothetical protein
MCFAVALLFPLRVSSYTICRPAHLLSSCRGSLGRAALGPSAASENTRLNRPLRSVNSHLTMVVM